MNSTLIFPEIFITGIMPQGATKESLLADGLSGWGCVMGGSELPKNFGIGMALVSSVLGTAVPEELLKLADELSDTNKL